MLTGKTAVVTGGSRGIGAAIVRKLASQGANVAVVYAGSQALAEELCAQCAAEFSGKSRGLPLRRGGFCCGEGPDGPDQKGVWHRGHPGEQRRGDPRRPAGHDEGGEL